MLPGITCQHEQNRDKLLARHSRMRGTRGVRLREERLEGGGRNSALYTAMGGSLGWTRDIWAYMYMVKKASRGASAARSIPIGIDIFGFLRVCTVVRDGLNGLVRLVRRWGVALLRHDRRSVSRVLQLISRNPIGFEGGKGPRICLGMGRTGGEALRVLQIATRACNAPFFP